MLPRDDKLNARQCILQAALPVVTERNRKCAPAYQYEDAHAKEFNK
jgi:hypothetical protein